MGDKVLTQTQTQISKTNEEEPAVIQQRLFDGLAST